MGEQSNALGVLYQMIFQGDAGATTAGQSQLQDPGDASPPVLLKGTYYTERKYFFLCLRAYIWSLNLRSNQILQRYATLPLYLEPPESENNEALPVWRLA